MNDKALHAMAGAVLGATAFFVPWYWAVGLVIAAGVGKEILDYFDHGKPDHLDALATIAAGCAVVAMLEAVGKYV